MDWKVEELSPVEMQEGVWLKREDLFAPLGAGSVNGSKLRGCVFLMERRRRFGTVFTGASVKSPQHSITAAIGDSLGIETVHIIGATNPVSAARHPQVAIASGFGAKFRIIKAAYNASLQKETLRLAEKHRGGVLPYGITPRPEEARDFHILGGKQVLNIPDEVESLIVPSGSCNTLVSIMSGLSSFRPMSLKRILSVCIGPSRTEWMNRRMELIGLKPMPWLSFESLSPHQEGFCSYQDEMPEKLGNVDLHGTYEGKVLRYLKSFFPGELSRRSCFWIVGGPSAPGRFPDSVKEWKEPCQP